MPYGTVGGQTAVGVQAASRIFFDKPAQQLTLRRGGAARRPAAGAVAVQPVPRPAARALTAPQRGAAARWPSQGYITQRQAARRDARSRSASSTTRYYTHAPRGLLLRLRQAAADRRATASRPSRQGGLQRLHDDRPQAAEARAQGDRRPARRARRPVRGDRHDRPAQRLHPRDGLVVELRRRRSSTSPPRATASRARRSRSMVLMTALRRGIDPNTTTYDSQPLNFVDSPSGARSTVKTVRPHATAGASTSSQATLKSDNTVYRSSTLDLGPEAGHARPPTTWASRATSTPTRPRASAASTLGVSPLEMANAYATIASGGWRNRPIAITKVVVPRRQRRHDTGQAAPHQGLHATASTCEATKILEAERRSAAPAPRAQHRLPGRRQDRHDRATSPTRGSTASRPRLTTAVWVGYPNASASMTAVHGVSVVGGTVPAQIWHDYMSQVAKASAAATSREPKEPFVAQPFFGKYAATGAPRRRRTATASRRQTGTTGAAARRTAPTTAGQRQRRRRDRQDVPADAVRAPPPQTAARQPATPAPAGRQPGAARPAARRRRRRRRRRPPG